MNHTKRRNIAELAEKVINGNAYFKIKGVTDGACVQIVADKIAEFVLAHYDVAAKPQVWHGVDIDKHIKELKQDLAIATSIKNKMHPQEQQLQLL